MIDSDGYRLNVGMVLFNSKGQVLWARRIGQNSWQFPQGGIDDGESPEDAMFRELKEELGLESSDVVIVQVSHSWYRYHLPHRLVRWDEKPLCVGQRQRWFLLRISGGHEDRITFDQSNVAPEFDGWRWVSYWYPVRQVISFKRDVYRLVMKEFSPAVINEMKGESNGFRSENCFGKRNRKI